MAENDVLGQDSIVPEETSAPQMDGTTSPINIGDSKSRFKAVREENAAKYGQRDRGYSTFELPDNISAKQFEKKLGAYHAIEGVDIPEAMAQAQSNWEQAGMGVIRTAAKIGSEIVKMVGTTAALAELPSMMWTDKSFGEIMNNGWVAAVDRANKDFNEWAAPVYETNEYKNGDFFDKLGDSSFWATQGADGVGFLVSMMIPGYALQKLVKPGAKVAGMVSTLKKVAKPGIDIEKWAASSKLAGQVDDYAAAGLNTFYESSAEAVERYRSALNENPEDKEGAARQAAQTFKANLAILIGPNILDQKWVMGGLRRSMLKSAAGEGLGKAGTKNVAEAIGKGMNKVTGEVGEKAAIKGVGSRIGNVVYNLGKGAVKEGVFEEGMQWAASDAATRSQEGDTRLDRTKETLKTYFEGLAGGPNANSEMWEGMALGAVLGSFMSGFGGYQQDKRENEQIKKYNDLLRQRGVNYPKSYTDFLKRKEDGTIEVNPETGNPEFDYEKIKAGGVSLIKNQELREELEVAIKTGDKDMADSLMNYIHLDYMAPWLELEGGKELFKEHLPFLIEQEKSMAARKGQVLTDTEIDALKQDLLTKLDTYSENISSINNTHDLNFNVKPEEGSTKQDINQYSEIIKGNKITQKASREFARSKQKEIENDLFLQNIVVDPTLTPDKKVANAKEKYEELKRTTTLDAQDKESIENDIQRLEEAVAYEDVSIKNLNKLFDAKFLQEGFKGYMTSKKKTTTAATSAATTTATAARARGIKDPALAQFWRDNVNTEDFADFDEQLQAIKDGEIVNIPMHKKIIITRPIVEVTFTNASGKKEKFFAALGDETATGGVQGIKVLKSKAGDWYASQNNSIVFFNAMNKVSVKTGDARTDFTEFDAEVKLHQSSQYLRKKRQESAYYDDLKKMINTYTEDRKTAETKHAQTVKDLKAAKALLTKYMKDHEADLVKLEAQKAKDAASNTMSITKVARRLYMIGDVVAQMEKTIEDLNNQKTESAQAIVKARDQKNKFAERMKLTRDSDMLPSEWLRDQLNTLQAIQEAEQALYEKIIDEHDAAVKFLNGYKRILRMHVHSLAKMLKVDISPKTLGIEALSKENQLDIQVSTVLAALDNHRSMAPTGVDPADMIGPREATEADVVGSMINELMARATQEQSKRIYPFENDMKILQEKMDATDAQFKSLKVQYDKLYVALKKLTPRFFAETKYYGEKLVESGALTSAEKDFSYAWDIAKDESDPAHPFVNWESLLTLTSNQDEVTNNPAVKMWFKFVKNYAYKGMVRKKGRREFAFKTYTFKQIEASGNNKLKKYVTFYDPTSGKLYTVDDVKNLEISDDKKDLLIERLSNDIKAIVVKFASKGSKGGIQYFYEDSGMPDYTDKATKTIPVFTSLGLPTEHYETSTGGKRVASETWRRNWVAERKKENPDLDEDDLMKDSLAPYHEAFDAALAEYADFRKKIESSSRTLYVTGVNPGIKNEDESVPMDVAEGINIDPKDIYVYVSNPLKGEDGQYAKFEKKTDIHTFILTRGFAYTMNGGHAEPIRMKNLDETGSVDGIFKLFQYIAKGGKEKVAVDKFLTDALDLSYSKLTDKSDPYRLYLHKARDTKGKEIPGQFDYVVYGENMIEMADLLDDKKSADFKKFLGKKRWNVLSRLLEKSHEKNFSEYKILPSGEAEEIIHDVDKGGYKHFLFSNKDGNKSKGEIKIVPPSNSDSETARMEFEALHPQYKNMSVRTSVSESMGKSSSSVGKDTKKKKKSVGGAFTHLVKITKTSKKDGKVSEKFAVYNEQTGKLSSTHDSLKAKDYKDKLFSEDFIKKVSSQFEAYTTKEDMSWEESIATFNENEDSPFTIAMDTVETFGTEEEVAEDDVLIEVDEDEAGIEVDESIEIDEETGDVIEVEEAPEGELSADELSLLESLTETDTKSKPSTKVEPTVIFSKISAFKSLANQMSTGPHPATYTDADGNPYVISSGVLLSNNDEDIQVYNTKTKEQFFINSKTFRDMIVEIKGVASKTNFGDPDVPVYWKETDPTKIKKTTPKVEPKEPKDPLWGEGDDELLRKATHPSRGEKLEIVAWFKNKYPNIPVDRVFGLIDGMGWGKFTRASHVMLSDLAEEGTLFHEGFHVWSQLVATPEARAKLYNEVRKITGLELTDKEAEEYIADQFMDFMIMGSKYKFPGETKEAKTLFQKIYNAIKDYLKNFFGLETKSEIRKAFETIRDTESFDIEPRRRDVELYKKVGDMTALQTEAAIADINYRFFQQFVKDLENDYNQLEMNMRANYTLMYDKIKENYGKNTNNPKIKIIFDNFEALKEKHKVFLRQYGLEIAEEDQELEEAINPEEEFIADEDKNKSRDYLAWQRASQKSLKDDMPSELRLLIGSIMHKEVVIDPKTKKRVLADVVSDYGTRTNVNFHRTMNILYNQLTKSATEAELWSSLIELAKKEPHLLQLVKRLGILNGKFHTNKLQAKLQAQFISTFLSDQPVNYVMQIKGDGVMTYSNALDNVGKRNAKFQWATIAKQDALNGKNKYLSIVDGEYIVDKSKVLADINKRQTAEDDLKILANLGIAIDLKTVRDKTQVVAAAEQYFERLRQIFSGMDKSKKITIDGLFSGDVVRNQKEANELAEALSGSNIEDRELMFINQSGKMEWAVTKNHHLSNVINRLDNYSRTSKKDRDAGVIPEELKTLKPYDGVEGNLFTVNSRIMAAAKKGKAPIMFNLKGLSDPSFEGAETESLTFGDYQMISFDSILRNVIPFKRAAERGPEYAIWFENASYNPSMGTVIKNMTDYLFDELTTTAAVNLSERSLIDDKFGKDLQNYGQNSKELRLFSYLYDPNYYKIKQKGTKEKAATIKEYRLPNFGEWAVTEATIIPEEKLKKMATKDLLYHLADKFKEKYSIEIQEITKNFILKSMGNNRESMQEVGMIKDIGGGMWSAPGINFDTLEDSNYFGYEEGRHWNSDHHITDEAMDKILLVHFNNNFIGLTEQYKVAIGDPAFYKNPLEILKRTTSSVSTITRIANDPKSRELADIYYPNVTRRPHGSTVNEIIIETLKGDASQQLVDKDAKHYADMDIIDGQMWGTLDFVRSTLVLQGMWTDAQEKTYQYEMQKFIYKVITTPELSRLWPEAKEEWFTEEGGVFYVHTGGKFTEDPMFEGEVIKPYYVKYNNKIGGIPMGQIPALKPLGAGYISDDTLNIGAMDISKMSVTGIFPSIIDEKKIPFVISMYRNDGDVVGDFKTKKADAFVNKIDMETEQFDPSKHRMTPISMSDYGTQHYIQDKDKKKVTDSSQKTATITNNIFNKGRLRAEFGNDEHLVDIITERDQIINDIADLNLEIAKESLGVRVNPDTGKYELPHTAESIVKFRKLLTELFEQRLLPDNISDGLDYVLSSRNKLIDLFSESEKIETILMAYMKNKVIRRKVSGEMYVQEAGYMYDTTLKFYSKGEDGTVSRAEVMVPIPTSWALWVGSIGGIDELNRRLEAGELDPHITQFIANRVPTADINTIEAFKIKKFLPSHVGSRIILPSAIVGKTSSDFDIDKLTSYLNNFRGGKNGPEYIQPSEHMDDANIRVRIAAMENRLNEIHGELLLRPERFDHLLEPSSNARLDKLATDLYKPTTPLDKAEMAEQDQWHSLTQWWYNNRKAKSFWSGIQGLSITAATNVVHSMHQRFPITITDDVVNLRYMKDMTKSTGGLFFFAGQQLTEKGQKYSSGAVMDMSGNYISDNFGQILVSEVDVAKKDFVSKLNLNTDTVGIVSFLNMFGNEKTASIKAILGMTSNPIISEYLKQKNASKSVFAKNNIYIKEEKNGYNEGGPSWYEENFGYDSDIVDRILKDPKYKGIKNRPGGYEMTVASEVKKYYQAANDTARGHHLSNIQTYLTRYNYKYFTDAQTKNPTPEDEIQMLDNFLMYIEFSKFGTKLNTLLRPNSESSFGKTINAVDLRATRLASLEDSGFFSPPDISRQLNSSNLSAADKLYQQTVDLFSWTTITRKYEAVGLGISVFVDKLTEGMKRSDQEEVMQKVKNDFLSFVYSFGFSNGGDISVIKKEYRRLIMGQNSMAKRLARLRVKSKSPILLALQNVLAETSFDTGVVKENDYVKPWSKRLGPTEINVVVSAAEELIESSDKAEADFGADLIIYAMLQNGPGRSPVSFMNLIPNSRFVPMMDKVVSRFVLTMDKLKPAVQESIVKNGFGEAFYRNNWGDNRIVPALDRYIKLTDEDKKKGNLDRHREITVKNTSWNANKRYVKVPMQAFTSKERATAEKAGKKLGTTFLLYRNTDIVTDERTKFELVGLLGDGMRFKEYYPVISGTNVLSIINKNGYVGVVPEYVAPKEDTKKKDKGKKSEKVVIETKEQKRYQLTSAEEAPNKTLDGMAIDFLNVAGVDIRALDMLRDKTGTKVPGIALSNLSRMTMEFVAGERKLDTLPEEAAHFYVHLLGADSALYKAMYKDIINHPVYQDVVNEYKDTKGYETERDFREEAMGKLIARRMIEANADGRSTDRQARQSDNWFTALMQAIRKFFGKVKSDPYMKSAYDIMDKNVSKLEIAKTDKTGVAERQMDSKVYSNMRRKLEALFPDIKLFEELSPVFAYGDYTENQIGKNKKAEYITQLTKRRPDLVERGLIDSVIAEVEKLGEENSPNKQGNPKLEKLALHWILNGNVILPEDGYKVVDAMETSERKKIDPFSFKNPNEIIEQFGVIAKKEEKINPDNVKEFSNKKEYSNGITVYDVQNDREGQLAVRKVVDSHFGKDSNPWCLVQKDKNGNFHGDAYPRWSSSYNAIDKRIAFQDGKLLAFRASANTTTQWWDRMDNNTTGIPANIKQPNGRLRKGQLDESLGGQLTVVGNEFIGDPLHGKYKEWFAGTDILLDEHTLINGRYHGNYLKSWNGDPTKVTKGQFDNGRFTGKWRLDAYLPIHFEVEPEVGEAEGSGQGFWGFTMVNSTNTDGYAEYDFLDGKTEGDFTEYFDNGIVAAKGKAKAGRKEGSVDLYDYEANLIGVHKYEKDKLFEVEALPYLADPTLPRDLWDVTKIDPRYTVVTSSIRHDEFGNIIYESRATMTETGKQLRAREKTYDHTGNLIYDKGSLFSQADGPFLNHTIAWIGENSEQVTVKTTGEQKYSELHGKVVSSNLDTDEILSSGEFYFGMPIGVHEFFRMKAFRGHEDGKLTATFDKNGVLQNWNVKAKDGSIIEEQDISYSIKALEVPDAFANYGIGNEGFWGIINYQSEMKDFQMMRSIREKGQTYGDARKERWERFNNKAPDMIEFQRNMEDRIIGQANIKAMSVLIDMINKKIDTLPHEYAHHYIKWFKGTPVVDRAIKEFGSEEQLVQAIGMRASDRENARAQSIWNKFINWLRGLFKSMNKTQRETFVDDLTTSFLAARDLETGDYIDSERSQQLAKMASGVENQVHTKLDEWNEISSPAKGIYKYVYKRTMDEGEKSFEAFKSKFGAENVNLYPSTADGYRAKIAIKKPIEEDSIEKEIIEKEDIAMENFKEMAKSPTVPFEASQLTLNFGHYFEDLNWMSESEKQGVIDALELGEIEISCKF